MKLQNFLSLFLIVVFIAGCDSHKARLTAQGEISYLQFELTDIENKTHDKSSYNLVHGSIYADIGVNKSLNLNCFKISLGNYVSENVYINNIASIATSNLIADSDGMISYKIYWSFKEGIKLEKDSLVGAKLISSKNFEQECISNT
ncbi:hypothetical protein EP12_04750 [Alteromonas australica]|uniref:hypothetical protein n=1 Tax=Alteromonas australica TaxID=589873 RepID=UPI0005C42047|nr:hypothetical protein [Alteromonas australica]AJP43115.1 hypothetical protein EP12_04750 [Alteromonas australica]|tara:strand:- start:905 stop:1342 length:438 start_codon:yes stop_codon:yes gene_type:complete